MLTYRPDYDQYTEGIFTDLTNAIPTNRGGYKNAYDSTDLAVTSLPGICNGSAFLRRLDGTVRVFAGIPQQIYEMNQTSATTGGWVNVSAAGTYTTSGSWQFAQFGDVSLAASYENVLQSSNGVIGTGFNPVSGAPKAKIIYTLGKRVILLNTASYTGAGQDGWAASSEGDYFTSALWPPAATNNAAYGTLNEVGGPITAGCSLGSLAIAWKRMGMWIGQDQGPPFQITWQKIPGNFGCVGLLSWCEIDGGVFFVSPQDMYIFDGSRPRSITDGVKSRFMSEFQADLNAGTVECMHDEVNNVVYVFMKTAFITLTFNYKTLQWGRISGYRGTPSETIQTGLRVNKASAYSINGFGNVQSADNAICVFNGNKLQVIGRDIMRTATTSTFTFNWWSPPEGAMRYGGLRYQATTLSATVSGFAEGILLSQGALTANATYPRLDGKYEGIFIAPKITITPSASSFFEFTQFYHDIKKVGKA